MAPVNVAHIFQWAHLQENPNISFSQSANGQMGMVEQKQDGHFVHAEHSLLRWVCWIY